TFERQSNPSMRDLFLMLAADACVRARRPDEAERLRNRLLELNPQHMLQGYPTFRDALRAPVVQQYLDERRQMYPLARAQQLLDSQYGGGAPAPVSAPIAPLPPDSFAEMTMPPVPRAPIPPPPVAPVPPVPRVPTSPTHVEGTVSGDFEGLKPGED